MPAADRVPTLTLVSRSNCHLCDRMIAGLQDLQARTRFEVRVVDVDAEPVLKARYDQHVPVLLHETRELCRHRLDASRITDYLGRIG
jgi:hypothetical protein